MTNVSNLIHEAPAEEEDPNEGDDPNEADDESDQDGNNPEEDEDDEYVMPEIPEGGRSRGRSFYIDADEEENSNLDKGDVCARSN